MLKYSRSIQSYVDVEIQSEYSFSQFLKIDTFCNFEKCCCMLVGLSVLFASGQGAAHCCNHPFWQCCQLAMKEEPVNLHLLKHILSGNIWEMALYTTYATYLWQWHCGHPFFLHAIAQVCLKMLIISNYISKSQPKVSK